MAVLVDEYEFLRLCELLEVKYELAEELSPLQRRVETLLCSRSVMFSVPTRPWQISLGFSWLLSSNWLCVCVLMWHCRLYQLYLKIVLLVNLVTVFLLFLDPCYFGPLVVVRHAPTHNSHNSQHRNVFADIKDRIIAESISMNQPQLSVETAGASDAL